MKKYITIASQFCREHNHDMKVFKLTAVIVRGGNVISVGYNKSSTNAFVEHYTDIVRGSRDYCLSTHAEMDAILKCRDKTDLVGCKIYIARIRKDNDKLGLARPCEICQRALFNYGIKKAYYSIDSNSYGVMKIVDPTILSKQNDNIYNV